MDENSNKNNNNNENKNIRFDINDTVDIVSAPAENKNSKAVIASLISVIIAAAVCITGVILYNKDTDSDNTETNYEQSVSQQAEQTERTSVNSIITLEDQSDSETTSKSSALINKDTSDTRPHTIVENTDSSEDSAEPLYNRETCEKVIKAYFDRLCYIEGSLGTDPVAMAVDGDDFEMISDINGTEISIIKIDGKLYFKRTALKKYAQLTDAVVQTLGISTDKISFGMIDNDYNSMKNCLTEITSVTVDGKEGVCFRYEKNGTFFRFCFVDSKPVQIDTGSNGEIKSTFVITEFMSSIPGDMLSLKGCTETGFMSLFADYM